MGEESAFRLDDRVAVVTGGGSGIGRAVAQTLARVGAAVVVGDIDATSGAATVAGIEATGGRAMFRRTDVTAQADVVGLVAAATEAFGGLDIMCNIAGAPSPAKPLLQVAESDFDRELTISVKSVLYGCQAAAEVMVRRGRGAIVNISSTAVDLPGAGYGLYHLGKVAVVCLTRTLALELGSAGIRVNAIAPGATLTGFSARHFTGPDGVVDEERRRKWLADMAERSPLGRVGTPEDQALLVLYLVSDAAQFVTGQTMRANGGWSMG